MKVKMEDERIEKYLILLIFRDKFDIENDGYVIYAILSWHWKRLGNNNGLGTIITEIWMFFG